MKKIETLKNLGRLAAGQDPVKPAPEAPELGPGHEISAHNQLWAYCHPKFLDSSIYQTGDRPVFAFLKPGDGLEKALESTRWLVFIGATDSSELRAALACPDCRIFVFEPDLRVLANFLENFDEAELAQKDIRFFCRDPESLGSSFFRSISADTALFGFPAIFTRQGFVRAYPVYLARLIERLEFFYYRHVVYRLAGQEGVGNVPSRKILRDLFFDQKRHLYENISSYLDAGVVDELQDSFKGSQAILVAVGPDLPSKIEFLRANRHKALIICVNKALAPLLNNGIEPHFVVINDTSQDSARDFAGLPKLEKTILVAHTLSGTGNGIFRRIYFFGHILRHIFAPTKWLKLHGSVITTAYSLARLLGCERICLCGVQLTSDNPYWIDYFEDSGMRKKPQELTRRYPELYQTPAASGEQMFTSLNFRDAALWFVDEIASNNLPVVNTTQRSLVFGKNISFAENPEIPAWPGLEERHASLKPKPARIDLRKLTQFCLDELEFWRNSRKAITPLLNSRDEDALYLAKSVKIIEFFDETNVSYLLQRFPGFDNLAFTQAFFGTSSLKAKRLAACDYFWHAASLADYFCESLTSALEVLKNRG